MPKQHVLVPRRSEGEELASTPTYAGANVLAERDDLKRVKRGDTVHPIKDINSDYTPEEKIEYAYCLAHLHGQGMNIALTDF